MCKVVRERAYSLAWHPSESKLLIAVGDKVGAFGVICLLSLGTRAAGYF